MASALRPVVSLRPGSGPPLAAGLRQHALVAGGFALLAALCLYPLGTRDGLLPDNADGVHSAWLLAWLSHVLPRHPLGAFQANILFPDQAALLYGEPVLSGGVLALPFYAVTGSSALAYAATLAVSIAMSGFFTYLLARELTGNTAAGLAAGAVFALTTANWDSVARFQIVSSQWTPLALYFLVRTLRTRRVSHGLACGAAIGLQGLACAYYEVFLAVLLVAAAPVWLLCTPAPRLRRFPWLPLLAGAALAALLLLPVNLAQYRHLENIESARPPGRPATVAGQLQALPGNWLWGGAFGLEGTRYDDRYFPGLLPPLLALLGAWALVAWRSSLAPGAARWSVPIVWMALCALLLSFGERLPTPWGSLPGLLPQLWFVPGLAETRVPGRFLMFTRLGVAVLVAAAVAVAWQRHPGGRRLLWGLLVLLPLEHVSVPLQTWQMPTRETAPGVYRWLARLPEPRPAIVEWPPYPVRLRRDESLWEHLSTLHWSPMLNGYSSYYPVHYDFVYDRLLELPSPLAFEVLRVLGVEYLVLHPRSPGHAEGDRALERFERRLPELGEALELVAAFDDPQGVAGPRAPHLGGERVFRVLPRRTPRPRRPRLSAAPAHSPEGWRCASDPEGGCERALDGDPASYFQTRSPQQPGEFLQVIFDRPLPVAGAALVSGVWSQHYPRELELAGLIGGEWVGLEHRALSLEFLQDMLADPRTAALDLRLLRPARLEGLQIRLAHSEPAFNPWLVPELRIYPPASGSPAAAGAAGSAR